MMLFNLARARLAKETMARAQAILNTHPQHWSKAWFRLGSNCDSVDNVCESFNKWIVEARFFPIITMLEIIRQKVMVKIHDQRTKASKWETAICPNILKKLNVYITDSGFCHPICNGESKHEVKRHDNGFTVDLEKKECSYRLWQLSGLHCPHAISCIFFKTNTLVDYIASCFSMANFSSTNIHCLANFNSTYIHCLMPVEGMNIWHVSDREPLKALGYVRMLDRPKKERREFLEQPKGTKMFKVGIVIRCHRCKQVGHNRSTCEKHHGGAQSSANSCAESFPALGAIVPIQNNQQSVSSFRKKETTEGGYQSGSKKSNLSQSKNVMRSSATATVTTTSHASATLNVSASIPNCHAIS